MSFPIRRDALGNTLGESVASASSSSGYNEKVFSAQEDARDQAMSQLVGVAAVPSPSYAPGQLGSGSFGVGDVNGLTLASFAPQGGGVAAAASAPFVDFDEYDRLGTLPQVGVVGAEGAQGAWGIAKSLAGSGANNAAVDHIKMTCPCFFGPIIPGGRLGWEWGDVAA